MKGNRGKEPAAWGQGGDSEPLPARHWGETNKTRRHYLRNLAWAPIWDPYLMSQVCKGADRRIRERYLEESQRTTSSSPSITTSSRACCHPSL